MGFGIQDGFLEDSGKTLGKLKWRKERYIIAETRINEPMRRIRVERPLP